MNRTKRAIVGVFLMCYLFGLNQLKAQEISKNKYDVEISASSLKIKHDGRFFRNYFFNSDLNFFYNINSVFSFGAYGGIGKYKEIAFYWVEENQYSASFDGVRSISYFYGLTGKIHIIELLGYNIEKADLFVKAKLGYIKMNSSKDPRITPAYGNYPDATINAGLSYYLSEHFGLTAEAGYRRFEYHQGLNARGGIIISF